MKSIFATLTAPQIKWLISVIDAIATEEKTVYIIDFHIAQKIKTQNNAVMSVQNVCVQPNRKIVVHIHVDGKNMHVECARPAD